MTSKRRPWAPWKPGSAWRTSSPDSSSRTKDHASDRRSPEYLSVRTVSDAHARRASYCPHAPVPLNGHLDEAEDRNEVALLEAARVRHNQLLKKQEKRPPHTESRDEARVSKGIRGARRRTPSGSQSRLATLWPILLQFGGSSMHARPYLFTNTSCCSPDVSPLADWSSPARSVNRARSFPRSCFDIWIVKVS